MNLFIFLLLLPLIDTFVYELSYEELLSLTQLKTLDEVDEYMESLPAGKVEEAEEVRGCPDSLTERVYKVLVVRPAGRQPFEILVPFTHRRVNVVDFKSVQNVSALCFYSNGCEEVNLEGLKLRFVPVLNCFGQEDSRLISEIKENLLRAPSATAGQYWFKGEPLNLKGEFGQPETLDKYVFHGQKGGFFIEAGATDFEVQSNTLLFELKRNWTGLLVEPWPPFYQAGLKRNRNAWSIQTCLAIQKRPHMSTFNLDSSDGRGRLHTGLVGPLSTRVPEKETSIQCLPIYSILMALNNPVVDLLVLDLEGAEFQVLQTIPWKKVNIRALLIETSYQGIVFPGTRQDIRNLLEAEGYSNYLTSTKDEVYVNKELLMKVDPAIDGIWDNACSSA